MGLTFDIRCLTSGNEKKMHIPNCNIQGSETNIFFSYIDYIKKLSNTNDLRISFLYFAIIVPESFAVQQFRDGGRSKNLGWQ